jgi:hypothetical protein
MSIDIGAIKGAKTMDKCSKCKHYERKETEVKFFRVGAFRKTPEGWCGNMLVSGTDVCPRFENKAQ